MMIIKRKLMLAAVAAALVLSAGITLRLRAADDKPAGTSGKDRFFEMRTYYAAEGKMDDLNARFRNHTNKLFRKHGMDLVGYWQPVDKKGVLVYILAYPSREAREKAWKDFQADPEWNKAREQSERNGKLVTKVEQV